jgi:hypothetical protein
VLQETYYNSKTVLHVDKNLNQHIHERLDALAEDVTSVTNVKFDYHDYRQESVPLFQDFVGSGATLGNHSTRRWLEPKMEMVNEISRRWR